MLEMDTVMKRVQNAFAVRGANSTTTSVEMAGEWSRMD